MSRDPIPCTVAILTFNSSATLPRALASVRDFAEIIICDGGSGDETLDIAIESGARVLSQDPQCLYPDGRIRDFGGVRNQTLAASTQPWFFFLDSDEYLSESLVEEIRDAIGQGIEGAYWIERKYVVRGQLIECATTYPNRSMRFFARASAVGFIKKIHERIQLKDGETPGYLKAPLLVPLDLDPVKDRAKDRHYIDIEVTRLLASPDPFRRIFLRAATFNLRASLIYGIRLIGILCFCRGTRMPLSDELARHGYHLDLIRRLLQRRKEAACNKA